MGAQTSLCCGTGGGARAASPACDGVDSRQEALWSTGACLSGRWAVGDARGLPEEGGGTVPWARSESGGHLRIQGIASKRRVSHPPNPPTYPPSLVPRRCGSCAPPARSAGHRGRGQPPGRSGRSARGTDHRASPAHFPQGPPGARPFAAPAGRADRSPVYPRGAPGACPAMGGIAERCGLGG